MGVEIERKFLVRGDAWRSQVQEAKEIRQGYLSLDPMRIVRVRLAAGKAYLTIKSGKDLLSRAEFEYAIPLSHAEEMLSKLCVGAIIHKTRHTVVSEDGHIWDVDEFHEPMTGLVLAEIELKHQDESFTPPGWASKEVTDDPRYTNHNMVEFR